MQGVNLIVQIVLARILMPKNFGVLAIIVAITNYAGLFVQSGISTVIVQKKDLDEDDLATLFTFSIVMAFILYIILFVLSPTISAYYNIPILKPTLRVLSLILFLNAINAVQSGLLSRKMQFKKFFLRSITSIPIAGLAGIILASSGFGVWALVIHNLLVVLLIDIFMAFDKDLRIHLGFSIQRFKNSYSYSIKILFTTLVSGLSDMVRTMIIGKYYTAENLAYYDKAYTYSYYAVSIVNSSISSVLLPTFSHEQDNILKLKNMARHSVRLSAYIMFPVLLGIAAIAEPLVIMILTEKWVLCAPYLVIFCLLRMPTFILSIDKQVYYALGKTQINLFYEICLGAFNIIVLLFTMRIGVMTIAIGALIGEWVGCIFSCFIAKKTYSYSIKERLLDIWKPLFSSLAMFLIAKGLELVPINMYIRLSVQIVVSIVIYLIIGKLLKDNNFNLILHLLKSIMKKSKDLV